MYAVRCTYAVQGCGRGANVPDAVSGVIAATNRRSMPLLSLGSEAEDAEAAACHE